MKKWMLLMLVGCLIIFGGVFGYYGFKQYMMAQYMASMPAPVTGVTAIEVKATDWTPVINAIGFIEPRQGVNLSAAVSAEVKDILFENGQSVKAGELLLAFDADKEIADLRSVQSRLKSAKLERDRLQKLAREKLSPQDQADSAAAEYDSLLAQVDSLKATIARREIRAPFDGITGILQVQKGQYVPAGTEIVRVENIDSMRIRFIIGEQDYARVAVGMPLQVKVSVYPGRKFSGIISAIEPAVDYLSGVVQLQATIPNSEKLLRAGMYAEVEIQQDLMPDQIVIPQSAISFSLYGETVYRIEQTDSAADTPELVAKLQTVKVIERRGNLALVGEGIKPGDKIVTTGQLKISSGARVKIIEDDTLAPPAELPRR